MPVTDLTRRADELGRRLIVRNDALQRQVGVRDQLVTRHDKLSSEVQKQVKAAGVADSALRFIETSVQSTRQEILRDIEAIADESLRTVYGENAPSLEWEVSVKRDRSSIVPWFVKQLPDGKTVKRRFEGCGCGVSDVTSLILRLVLLRASGTAPVLVIDEPFRNLGVLQVPHASALLRQVAKKLGVQVILTTHWSATVEQGDVVFWFELDKNGVVQATKEEKHAERQ
jgi:DNA repair exonuclease SbcCD ATPase subunit